ncbi:MAG: hypothetical protein Q8K91_08955 [Hylemonella sp.]|nr:hypothetical protein [Hylemonella sp.]MDP1937318.1 hypothetical protein [Hylemonella sp.]
MNKPAFYVLALCAALNGCCSTPTHEAYVKHSNAGIGKTYAELFPEYASTRDQDIKRYETHYDKIEYRGVRVYAPKDVSLDGVEGLSDKSNWCIARNLIEVETLRIADWKYVKGSNPAKCTARLTPCEGGTGW